MYFDKQKTAFGPAKPAAGI